MKSSRFAIGSTLALTASLAVWVASPATSQQTINFSDLPTSGYTGTRLSAGYGGLQWGNMGWYTSSQAVLYYTTTTNPTGGNGYANGVVAAGPGGTFSSGNVAYNGFSSGCYFSSTTNFTLNTMDLTAADHDGLNVVIEGKEGSTVVDSVTEILNTSGPQLLTFNWQGIDNVDFSTSGGTVHPNWPDAFGGEFAMGQLTINGPISAPGVPGVPEPGAVSIFAGLLVAGSSFQVLRRRRK